MATTVNGKQMAMAPREEDLAELQDVLRDMQKRVDDARADGRVYMMGQYARMVTLISPEIDRVQRRFIREMNANINRDHKDLRAQARAELADAKAADEAAARNRANA